MSDEIVVPHTIAEDFALMIKAREAKARWAAEEKDRKERILAYLGYDPEDPKPVPVLAVAPSGVPLFQVKVSRRKGLDLKYFRDAHPAVYAECETSTPVKSIREYADVSTERDG